MPAASRPLIIAHRGESWDAPENTLVAIRLAWERGARAVELDVRRTADDEVVVVHDADLRRLAGLRRRIASLTWEELLRADVGAWKHRRWTGERVPRLEQVLATVPPGGRLFVEIKEGPEIVPALQRVLQRSHLAPSQVLLMSFNEETMACTAAALPEHEACLLVTARHWRVIGGVARAIRRARELGCSSLDVQTHRSLNAAMVDLVHAAHMRLYTWTVNRVSTARRLAGAGIDGITTDRCAWMVERLARRP